MAEHHDLGEGLRREDLGDGVVRVVIDRPPANALSTGLRLDLARAWRSLSDDDFVGCVIVTGAGDRFFSAGLDLDELAQDFEAGRSPEELHAKIDQLAWDPVQVGFDKPVIAAINGYCVAGGWALAQACDVRLAADTAMFGVPEAALGLPAIFAAELATQVPPNLAAEVVLWAGRRFTARRMAEIGFVNLVVPAAELAGTAEAWAAEVARLPRAAVRAHKRLLLLARREANQRLREAAQREVRSLYDDADAGVRVRDFAARRRSEKAAVTR